MTGCAVLWMPQKLYTVCRLFAVALNVEMIQEELSFRNPIQRKWWRKHFEELQWLMLPVGIVCFVSADWEMCCRYKILYWTTDIHVVSCPHRLIVSSELVCCGFVSVCKTSLKESGKWITFDHLPLADRDETCLSRRVWSVGLSPFQDIVLTLKDKLSIRAIEYFALVLEQQYSITKLLLLHEDELVQKVKKIFSAQTQKMIL